MTTWQQRVETIRSDPQTRRAAFAVAAAVGVVVGWFHWIGFVVGGALVGLFARDQTWAAVAGLGFGIVAWATFAAWLVLHGVFDTYLAMGQILVVSAVIPIVGGVVGSLVRGLV